MKKFKIRCSAIGKIMTDPRTNKAKEAGELSETAKTYCEEWLKEQLYGKEIGFSNKYTQKGNIVEQDAIDFFTSQNGLDTTIKNEMRYENEYIEGTPDAIFNDFIIDVKSSWGVSTFPLFETEIPTKDYIYQGLGYMNLTGIHKFKLVYVLIDTPYHLIKKEASNYAYNFGYDLDDDLIDEFRAKMTFSHIDPKLRLRVFDVEYEQEIINKINQRVIQCRNYIDNLLTLL